MRNACIGGAADDKPAPLRVYVPLFPHSRWGASWSTAGKFNRIPDAFETAEGGEFRAGNRQAFASHHVGRDEKATVYDEGRRHGEVATLVMCWPGWPSWPGCRACSDTAGLYTGGSSRPARGRGSDPRPFRAARQGLLEPRRAVVDVDVGRRGSSRAKIEPPSKAATCHARMRIRLSRDNRVGCRVSPCPCPCPCPCLFIPAPGGRLRDELVVAAAVVVMVISSGW